MLARAREHCRGLSNVEFLQRDLTDLGELKGAIEIAREAMSDARRHPERSVDPGRVWVIGDTPHEVSCARAIGANVVAVLTGRHGRDELLPHAPDLILDDLSDPGPWLGRW
jgi:phosphoglycolate phosphatase-like HAD superfamily hydrolase